MGFTSLVQISYLTRSVLPRYLAPEQKRLENSNSSWHAIYFSVADSLYNDGTMVLDEEEALLVLPFSQYRLPDIGALEVATQVTHSSHLAKVAPLRMTFGSWVMFSTLRGAVCFCRSTDVLVTSIPST